MILTISNTTKPAGNLGFLLHKHPDKLQTIDLAVGRAHIFYPQSSANRTTVALMLEIDPIDMAADFHWDSTLMTDLMWSPLS